MSNLVSLQAYTKCILVSASRYYAQSLLHSFTGHVSFAHADSKTHAFAYSTYITDTVHTFDTGGRAWFDIVDTPQ